ncbi:MAG TPA: Spy/CpxP family protein refolding chaperone [Xanthobacteraceae bacterium]|nr:Spy/CpxP family protein refolding chaperone [Xanthobacteraceae bacterium]
MKSLKIGVLVAAAMAAAVVGTASAQNQPTQQQQWGWRFMAPGMMGPAMMGNGAGWMGSWMMAGAGSGQAMCNAMAGHIEGRLGYIKAELKITDAQESLWNAYAAAARDNANTMIARCTTMMSQRGSQVSLPDRLDENEQLMAAQLDAVRAMNKALKPLYAALNDTQKQAADQLFWGPMGMM